jgi:signal transduction histidine kinase
MRQRSEQLYLLFFLVSVASFLRTLHYHVGENRLLMSDEWFSWLTVNSLFWLVAIVHLFINHLHGHGARLLTVSVWALTSAITIGTLPVFPGLPSVYLVAPQAYVLLLLIGISVGLYGYIQSHRHGSQDGKLLSGWCLIGMLLWLYDWLLQTNRIDIEGIYVGPYMNLVGFVVFLYIMFRRYVGALDAVRQTNSSLEVRLQQQETELRKQHDKLREGEHKQTLTAERQRLMQDMHDGMGSSLRSALLAVERGKLSPESVAEVLKDCIDDLKLAIDAMEPVQADLLLLLATLRYRLGPRLEAAGISLLWDVEDVPVLNWLDPRNSLHIVRIVQESFTNIIKHTEASEIRVSTRSNQNQVVVTISDNGCGFDVSNLANHHGRGLSNQKSRADSIGVDIQWQSDKNGTTLTLLLPVERRLKTRDGSKNWSVFSSQMLR